MSLTTLWLICIPDWKFESSWFHSFSLPIHMQNVKVRVETDRWSRLHYRITRSVRITYFAYTTCLATPVGVTQYLVILIALWCMHSHSCTVPACDGHRAMLHILYHANMALCVKNKNVAVLAEVPRNSALCRPIELEVHVSYYSLCQERYSRAISCCSASPAAASPFISWNTISQHVNFKELV